MGRKGRTTEITEAYRFWAFLGAAGRRRFAVAFFWAAANVAKARMTTLRYAILESKHKSRCY